MIYSSSASRPNTPVNICISALIIKELFCLSDDEVPVSGNAVMIMSLPIVWTCSMDA